jgi:hypothetical protein
MWVAKGSSDDAITIPFRTMDGVANGSLHELGSSPRVIAGFLPQGVIGVEVG